MIDYPSHLYTNERKGTAEVRKDIDVNEHDRLSIHTCDYPSHLYTNERKGTKDIDVNEHDRLSITLVYKLR